MAILFARSRNLVSILRQTLGLSTILTRRDFSPRPFVFTASQLYSTAFLGPVASHRHESTAVEIHPGLVQQSDEEDVQVFIWLFNHLVRVL